MEIGAKKLIEDGPVDENLLNKMRNASPIAHVHKVKAPTILMVGSKDLRVPPSQSMLYYNKLRANNVTVK